MSRVITGDILVEIDVAADTVQNSACAIPEYVGIINLVLILKSAQNLIHSYQCNVYSDQ